MPGILSKASSVTFDDNFYIQTIANTVQIIMFNISKNIATREDYYSLSQAYGNIQPFYKFYACEKQQNSDVKNYEYITNLIYDIISVCEKFLYDK